MRADDPYQGYVVIMFYHVLSISSVSFTARSTEIYLTTICEMLSFWSRTEVDQPCRLLPFCLHFFKICVDVMVSAPQAGQLYYTSGAPRLGASIHRTDRASSTL